MMLKNLKSDIIRFLKDKGNYDPIDILLIDELIINFEFARDAVNAIHDSEMIITETRVGKSGVTYELTKKSLHFDIYNRSLENVRKILSSLGVSPSDRVKLKIIQDADATDELTDFDC